ncbi:succinyl-diaminopimelate desuccinylase [Actinotalea sp.]|uniref:succinyl-diaminopimelate desuccinylase n=1 Tax=Actinotalea sp. TaxID=1872145 RepID=UPI002B8E3663|nr:succinyl-diaminopimelate desuccinylase [Actinotalea sp.]HQY33101.1 succinyl-diaminopimelate desuccinylase [Actinotalea sp.]HRA50986.1 succinyl-diaminopimelate desuccinylase [Actinotalea sp.]
MSLDLHGDLVDLTRAVCDIPSVSGDERALADAVEVALRACPHLEVLRDGDAVVARTHLGRAERVVVAGHLDTVPLAGNLPSELRDGPDGPEVWGRGTVDMKAGVAVQLALAARLSEPTRDVTWVFYDQEEVASERNGLGRLVAHHPEWLAADFAVLGEPTAAGIEGGCNGTLRVEVRVPGTAAHSARSWLGVNAVHGAAPVLATLAAYAPRSVEVDGLTYREGLNAVGIRGGIAGNVIPDECVVTVNYRFAPAWSEAQALEHVREVFAGHEVTVTDSAPGARPGLTHPAAARFAAVVGDLTGRPPTAKLGWTDVARFATLGVPAVNFGPGDPNLAHADDERCPVAHLAACFDGLRAWLTS